MTAKQKAARAKFKAIVKEASKLRKKNPKLTQAQAVKQAWAISYSKKRARVGAVKKKAAKKKAATKVKAKKSRSTEMHTDTKSHNVNIRVISGIGAIKRSAETLLKNQYGNLAAKKLVEKTKRGKSKIAKSMREIATKIRKIENL